MGNFKNKKKYHLIYKTTNLLNGKFYIGIHSTSNLKDGYLGSGKRLKYSVAKYGKENFKLDILEFVDTREKLILKEKELVNSELLKDVNCLNLQTGGISGFDYLKQYRVDNPEYAKKWKEEQGEKFKAAHKKGLIKYDTFTGKQHSEESKNLMSKKKKGTGTGNTNSQFGTCWITKDGLNKKIKKEELNNFIYSGWNKGRT
jgi:group I intron endonuclease